MDPESLMNSTSGLLGGADIASILQSEGPIVKCVLLKASCKSAEIDEEKVAEHQSSDEESLKEKSAKEGKNSIILEQVPEPKSFEVVTNPTKKENDNTKTSSEENTTSDANDKDKESEEFDEKEAKKEMKKESDSKNQDDISEIEIDTTPKKSMVEQVLGGPFTFLGQYEDEGIVLMIRQQDRSSLDLPINTHKLQPPFHKAQNCIRGDILVMKVAGNEDNDENNDENDFFQNYTKDSYLKFAARTDIIALPDEDDDDEDDEGSNIFEGRQQQNDISDNDNDNEGDDSQEEDEEFDPLEMDDEDEEEDEDCQIGMMNLIFGQVLKQFREENGRGPDTVELLAMRQALADKLGVQLGDTANSANDASDDDNKNTDDTDLKRRRDDHDNDTRKNKRVKFAMQDSSDEPSTSTLQPDENQTTTVTEDSYCLKEGEAEI